jgi:hypothetical protein
MPHAKLCCTSIIGSKNTAAAIRTKSIILM